MNLKLGAEIGATFGIIITIDWDHIVSKGIETAILAFVGGVLGAIGGVLITWMAKQLKK